MVRLEVTRDASSSGDFQRSRTLSPTYAVATQRNAQPAPDRPPLTSAMVPLDGTLEPKNTAFHRVLISSSRLGATRVPHSASSTRTLFSRGTLCTVGPATVMSRRKLAWNTRHTRSLPGLRRRDSPGRAELGAIELYFLPPLSN